MVRTSTACPAPALISPRNTFLELQFFNRAIQRPLSMARNPYYLCCLAYGYSRSSLGQRLAAAGEV